MTKVIGHLKQNLIAYLALFVALGGTSYAALRLPAGSVGNRQLENHSVTPVKLDRGKTAGYVADWAQITSGGLLVTSRPRGAKVLGWNGSPNAPVIGGSIQWRNRLSDACVPMVSDGDVAGDTVSIGAQLNGPVSRPYVSIHESAPATVNIAIICPIP